MLRFQPCQDCQFCEACGEPEAGDCCVANGTPYCDDADCCLVICEFDPFCCDIQWDSIRADSATVVPTCNCIK